MTDEYIGNLIKKKTTVTIYTINGAQVKGMISRCDNLAICVMQNGIEVLIYKHAVSTIQPLR